MRIMSRQDPGGIHFHTFWAARADDETLPLWLRIAALAYGSHAKNGHAKCYLQGASTLPDLLKRDRRQIQNEIRRAIGYGFLGAESNINCLVLPVGIEGGAEGTAKTICKHHPVTLSVTARDADQRKHEDW